MFIASFREKKKVKMSVKDRRVISKSVFNFHMPSFHLSVPGHSSWGAEFSNSRIIPRDTELLYSVFLSLMYMSATRSLKDETTYPALKCCAVRFSEKKFSVPWWSEHCYRGFSTLPSIRLPNETLNWTELMWFWHEKKLQKRYLSSAVHCYIGHYQFISQSVKPGT